LAKQDQAKDQYHALFPEVGADSCNMDEIENIGGSMSPSRISLEHVLW